MLILGGGGCRFGDRYGYIGGCSYYEEGGGVLGQTLDMLIL